MSTQDVPEAPRMLLKKKMTMKDVPEGALMYNEFGNLVEVKDHAKPINSKLMSVTPMIRLINYNWHHQFRRRMGDVFAAQLDGNSPFDDGHLTLSGRLMSWELKTIAAKQYPVTNTMGGGFKVAVYDGPPRILDIGCDGGKWCFALKKQHPDWIVEGVDDDKHWALFYPSIAIKDFMDGVAPAHKRIADPFRGIHNTQSTPELTVRNLNTLVIHKNPIPHNLYGYIHATDIFAKVDSYRTFLEEVRLILQPDGVVEFVEFDPRPRTVKSSEDPGHNDSKDYTSKAATDFTDNMADRFKSPFDEDLATDVPGWAARVNERVVASLRPRDGIAAANLKSWLEGAGFWDVKQDVVKLPVGGDTRSGKLLLEFLLWQTSLEDNIPRIAETLPKLELNALNSGSYYINLHIITGRKPHQPRPGDILLDGSREGMTDSKQDSMTRYTKLSLTTSWERHSKFDLGRSIAVSRGNIKPGKYGPNLRDRVSSLKMHGQPIGDGSDEGTIFKAGRKRPATAEASDSVAAAEAKHRAVKHGSIKQGAVKCGPIKQGPIKHETVKMGVVKEGADKDGTDEDETDVDESFAY